MNIESEHPFLHTIFQLRKNEELVLFDKFIIPSENECLIVNDFLEQEYQMESLEYPYQSPAYDSHSAVWAARTLYIFTQLVLYRKHDEKEVAGLFSPFDGEIYPGSLLSADLCLRFLPQLRSGIKNIDIEDVILPEFDKVLQEWHYSSIGTSFEIEKADFSIILKNDCLKQLYADRIVERKDLKLAEYPVWKEIIQGNLGLYTEQFWKEFKN